MPSVGESPDTSVLVAALAAWHPGHEVARRAVGSVQTVIAHVLLESYSVLTRLPAPHRIAPIDAAAALDELPWAARGLSPAGHRRLIRDAAAGLIAGGAVYDALVAGTAREHGLTLITADRRAWRTYEALGVPQRMVLWPD